MSRKISKIWVIAKIKNFMVFRVEVCKLFSGKGVTWEGLFDCVTLCELSLEEGWAKAEKSKAGVYA